MTRLERELYKLGHSSTPLPQPEAVSRAVEAARQAFYIGQSQRSISYFDFLLTQMRTIQKRWWLMQAALLTALWCIVSQSSGIPETRRLIDAIVPLFTIAAAPELWKNLRIGSMEIEGTSYFTLREIYSARLTLFEPAERILPVLHQPRTHGSCPPYFGAAPALYSNLLHMLSRAVFAALPLRVAGCGAVSALDRALVKRTAPRGALQPYLSAGLGPAFAAMHCIPGPVRTPHTE